MKVLFARALNGVSQKILMSYGWSTLDEVHLREYKNSKDLNPFEKYDETVKSLKTLSFESVKLMYCQHLQ